MVESIAVDGRYAYTGRDIKLALLETKVVDLTPWGRRLDNDGKMTHWPSWMKSASPARDAAMHTDKEQLILAWYANSSADNHRKWFPGTCSQRGRNWRRSLQL